MSITQKLDIYYKNQIENIKKEKNYNSKIKMIGALALDVGGRCFSAIAKACNVSRKFVKKCYLIAKDNLEITSNRHKCGRKGFIENYPTLKADIDKIMKDNTYIDPHFECENLHVNLTFKEIRKKLFKTGNYGEKEEFISRNTLSKILYKFGYKLKKVKRDMPIKKIDETDNIFIKYNLYKAIAEMFENWALISLDAKAPTYIGPFSRGGKTRTQLHAADHELTKNYTTIFGILDVKNNQPYLHNFINKPTSEAICTCIEDYIINNPQYDTICICLDNGPDNSGVRTAFLVGLSKLSFKYKVKIILNYLPPYHSKYNPVERLWGRLENMWSGLLLTSVDKVNDVLSRLTWNGVKAIVKVHTEEYKKGVKYSKDEMEKYNETCIKRSPSLKKWEIEIDATMLSEL